MQKNMEQNILSFYELNILKLSFSFFLMWTIFEVFFEFVTMLFLFYVLFCLFVFFHCKACGIFASWPRIQLALPALEGKVLTTGPPGKSPILKILNVQDTSCILCSMCLKGNLQ